MQEVDCGTGQSQKPLRDDGNHYQKCLFCLDMVTPAIGGDSEETLPFLLPGSKENTSLNQQLWSVFVLRQLLKLPGKKMASLLKKSGGVSPSEWFVVCETCKMMVKEAVGIYQELLEAADRFKKLRIAVTRKIWESSEGLKEKKERKGVLGDDISSELRRRFKEQEPPPAVPVQPSVESEVKTENDSLEENDLELDTSALEEPDLDMAGYMDENEDFSDPLYTPEDEDDCLDVQETTIKPRRCRKARHIPRTEMEEMDQDKQKILQRKSKSVKANKILKTVKKLGSNRFPTLTQQINKYFQDGNYSCPECPAKYPIRRKFVRHWALHRRKGAHLTFTCDICNYVAANSGGLRIHLRREHNTIIKCHICKLQFSYKSALDEHHKLKHSNDEDETTVNNVNVVAASETKLETPDIQKPQFKCEQCRCQRLFGSENSLRVHLVRHKKYRKTSCPKCNYPCVSATALKAHLARNLCNRRFEYSCDQCNFKTYRLYLFEAHAQMHRLQKEVEVGVGEPISAIIEPGQKYKFNCTLCEFKTDKRYAIRKHRMFEHPNVISKQRRKGETVLKTYSCHLCLFKTLNNKNFDNHIATHKTFDKGENIDGKWRCTLCGYECTGRTNFGHHMRENHGTELGLQSFVCTQCGKNFARKDNLTCHIAEVHTNQCKFCCEICGYGTMKQSTLAKHMKTHSTENSIVCHLCGLVLKTKSSLPTHMKNVHSDNANTRSIEKFKCKACSVSFVSRNLWKEHMKTAHRELYVHKCEECGNDYASVASLQLHQKIKHSGNGPFKCQFCPAIVNSTTSFYTHYKFYCKKKPKDFKYSISG